MFLGGKPLFPGCMQVVSGAVLTPGQVHAVKCALAFAAVDKRLQGRPMVAYFGSLVQDDKVTGNIATLCEIEDVLTDDEGKLKSVSLAGVSRAIIPKVRQVRDKPLLVADRWKVYLDDIPPSSYMHTLERLRVLANTCNDEHNKRRQIASQISSVMDHLQICDELSGSCDTDALLQLGQEVYARAMEIMAERTASKKGSDQRAMVTFADDTWMVETIQDISQRYAARVERWSDLWPEWGDEIDGELRLLKSMSFAIWQSLGRHPSSTRASTRELNLAMNGCCTISRFEAAIDKLQEERRQLQRTLRTLEKLRSSLSTVTLKRDRTRDTD